jgi:hypothetical protein
MRLSIPAAPVRRSLDNDRRRRHDMQYALLIHTDEQIWPSLNEDDRNALVAEYGSYTQELRDAGVMLGGDALQPTQTATTVRVRDGETLTTDGPFAETKEQFGGYYLIDVASLDEALEWAAKIPGARTGSIEVRPVMPTMAETAA